MSFVVVDVSPFRPHIRVVAMADTCCKAFLDPTAAVEAAIYLFLPPPVPR